MKKIFTLFFLMTALFATAQETADTMYIYRSDNTVKRIAVADIDSVTFVAPVSVVTPPAATQYEAVDLGLSVKWATCNVGASKPEDYGGYYAWGETEEIEDYSWSTYKWCNGSKDTMTKYCTSSSYGTVDNKTTLDPEDDVARVKWGGSWRMPTLAEQDELRNKCTWTWTTKNGVKGYTVTGPNGNSIFLPAAGGCNDSTLFDCGSSGCYWSSSLNDGINTRAFSLDLDSSNYNLGGFARRYIGLSVRPVSE